MDPLLQIASHLGIEVLPLPHPPDFPYTPGRISYWVQSGCPESDVAHEIAHWLVAAPSRRKRRNYGLGWAYIGLGTSMVVSQETSDAEEEMASALEILIERCLGLDWKRTFDDHQWNAKDFLSMRKKLIRKGFLGKHGTPLIILEVFGENVLDPGEKAA